MASLPHPKTVTYEEWLRMPETKGEEVVDGEIRQMPAPKPVHAQIIFELSYLIGSQVNRREVAIFASAFDLIIRRQPLTARQPDLAVFRASGMIEREGRIHSAPELIIEVLSPRNTPRELSAKLADYAFLGVPEIWVFSYEDRTVEVLHLINGMYVSQPASTTLRPLHFPEGAIEISQIWPA